MARRPSGSQRRQIATSVAACGFCLALALPADAQAPVPEGVEFQVNSYTTSYQLEPVVAAGGDGGFVVAWASNGSPGTDTSLFSVQSQRFSSTGSREGAQFQVNTDTRFEQGGHAVAVDADGDFVVVWSSSVSFGTDTDSFSVQGQRYASDGSPRGAQFQVNSYTTSFQAVPSVAAAANGDFVVVWYSEGSFRTNWIWDSIQGQRYASDGSPRGSEFAVNSYFSATLRVPAVAMANDGDFVVVWSSTGSYGTDASGYDFSIQGAPALPVPAPGGGARLRAAALLALRGSRPQSGRRRARTASGASRRRRSVSSPRSPRHRCAGMTPRPTRSPQRIKAGVPGGSAPTRIISDVRAKSAHASPRVAFGQSITPGPSGHSSTFSG